MGANFDTALPPDVEDEELPLPLPLPDPLPSDVDLDVIPRQASILLISQQSQPRCAHYQPVTAC